jgi:hypothetical protein
MLSAGVLEQSVGARSRVGKDCRTPARQASAVGGIDFWLHKSLKIPSQVGATRSISCLAEGNPEPEFEWLQKIEEKVFGIVL